MYIIYMYPTTYASCSNWSNSFAAKDLQHLTSRGAALLAWKMTGSNTVPAFGGNVSSGSGRQTEAKRDKMQTLNTIKTRSTTNQQKTRGKNNTHQAKPTQQTTRPLCPSRSPSFARQLLVRAAFDEEGARSMGSESPTGEKNPTVFVWMKLSCSFFSNP